MKNKHWGKIGVINETYFLSLHYNEKAKALLAEFQREADGILFHSIYIRKKDEEQYHKLTPESTTLGYHFPITSNNSPYLYCNEVEWLNGGGNPIRIIRYNLLTEQIDGELTNSDLDVNPPYKNILLSDLYGTTDDESIIHCSLGMSREIEENNFAMDYWLCKLDFNNKSYEKITLLKGVFL